MKQRHTALAIREEGSKPPLQVTVAVASAASRGVPLGLFGPAALATAGGACVAVDGPLPVGDVIGLPLLAAAGAWAATEVIKDWWDNRNDCEDCEVLDVCRRLLDLCLANRRVL